MKYRIIYVEGLSKTTK